MTYERYVSGGVLATVLALGIALAVSLPQQENQRVTLDIRCVSGASVAGVWIQAENGGSGFAEATDDDGAFAYELGFGGAYKAHVGCGGSRQRWKKVMHSGVDDRPNRMLLCDDTAEISPGPCRDLP